MSNRRLITSDRELLAVLKCLVHYFAVHAEQFRVVIFPPHTFILPNKEIPLEINPERLFDSYKGDTADNSFSFGAKIMPIGIRDGLRYLGATAYLLSASRQLFIEESKLTGTTRNWLRLDSKLASLINGLLIGEITEISCAKKELEKMTAILSADQETDLSANQELVCETFSEVELTELYNNLFSDLSGLSHDDIMRDFSAIDKLLIDSQAVA